MRSLKFLQSFNLRISVLCAKFSRIYEIQNNFRHKKFHQATKKSLQTFLKNYFKIQMVEKWLIGNRILVEGKLQPGRIKIRNGRIAEIHLGDYNDAGTFENVIYTGNKVVMAALVDSHVHVNEPGRTEWEGYYTATRAAAAGGVATIIDMPLNSIPPTTTVANFETKLSSTHGKRFVDVGFWGGVIPNNADELKPLVNNGVVGFKCFLIHSGVDEFPSVDEKEVDVALSKLKGTGSLLAFHAEVQTEVSPETKTGNKTVYETFLESRPPQMEIGAIDMVARMCRKHKDVRCHIVHLSASDALPIISDLKRGGYPLTVETCPHYLTLDDSEIGPCRTDYKCCPPIRDSKNQELLWEGLRTGLIDMIVSDHSPCTADLKRPGELDFMTAWGGIASVQFGLPIIWTNASRRGFDLAHVTRWMSENPAKLAGLGKVKGQIAPGYDADFVIWEPEEKISICDNTILFKNKVTPYKGKELKGKVHQTILRGEIIYDEGKLSAEGKGQLLLVNDLEHKGQGH